MRSESSNPDWKNVYPRYRSGLFIEMRTSRFSLCSGSTRRTRLEKFFGISVPGYLSCLKSSSVRREGLVEAALAQQELVSASVEDEGLRLREAHLTPAMCRRCRQNLRVSIKAEVRFAFVIFHRDR